MRDQGMVFIRNLKPSLKLTYGVQLKLNDTQVHVMYKAKFSILE